MATSSNSQDQAQASTEATENIKLEAKEITNTEEIKKEPTKAKRIVRIKRKRNELPLESLLVEEEFAEKKKAFKPTVPTRFRLVNTLELNSFPELPSVPIENTAKESDSTSKEKPSEANSSKPFKGFKKANLSTFHKSSPVNTSLRERDFISKIQNERRNVTSQRLEAQRKAARYKIVSKSRILPESSDDETELDLPKGKSKKRPIELYDAVMESSDVDESTEMEPTDITVNLQRLFKETLVLDAEKYGSTIEEDYVYDVYEIDDAPFEAQTSTGVLSWLRFSESDNEKIEEMGVYSESEPEDDEDSNAEDHYANDYPEEFDTDSEQGYNEYAYDSEYDSDQGQSISAARNNSGGFYCDDDDYY